MKIRTTLAALSVLALAACASPQQQTPADDTAPIRFGLIYSQSGLLASYGEQYLRGFDAGLHYATGGTGKVGNRPIEIVKADDGGDPAKATAAAKDLIGKGIKMIGGTGSSSVAVQLAPLAAQNKVLFIDGPASADAITGANRYTFRAGRQTLQDVLNIKAAVGAPAGKKIAVFAQDNTFGQGNFKAVQTVLGAAGATVSAILVPVAATDFTPFALQAKDAHADLLYVSWAGNTGAAMWQALHQQGVLASTAVLTGLDQRPSWPQFGQAATGVTFAAHYVDGASDNAAAKALRAFGTGGPIDTFSPDGFNLAQMLVRAAQAGGGEDVEKMISALEGWSFEGVKGTLTVRAEDHALLQPMYQVKLSGQPSAFTATVVRTLSPQEVAPPPVAMKG
ncbi:MAG: substrate-binding domain-containing protein [Hamadaea sp.]|nr:substrate-binding domain-containing protein [Hamadaea sp.]